MQEQIDIYDADGRRTGKVVARKGAFLHEGEYALYVLAIIQNAAGRYLITRRSLDKAWAAGWWEVTGGGVRAGESSRDAVIREVREETGLEIAGLPDAERPVYRYENVDLERGDNYIVDIYHVRMDFSLADVRVQPEEVIGMQLASAEEIDHLAEEGVFLHYERIRQALAAERARHEERG